MSFDVAWHKRDDDIRVRKYVILFYVFFIQPWRASWRATAKLTLGSSFSTAHLNSILSMIQYDCTSGKMFKPQIFKSLFSPHGMTEIPPYVALKELFDVVGNMQPEFDSLQRKDWSHSRVWYGKY